MNAAQRMLTVIALTGLALAACAPAAMVNHRAGMPMDGGAADVRTASSLIWNDRNTPGFKPGMKVAVVRGDPSAAGTYVLRLWFPAGYEFPVHWHPNGENITVISGTFLLGMGPVADRSLQREYRAGDYLFAPARMPHYGGAREETVIQLHGFGPFTVNLGAP